jgi:hypothetical protein
MANLDSTSIPTFKILALGMRGSGKTVFLASMYHFLSAYRENRGYFLSCPDERKSADLLEKFGEISDSDDWPEGNSTLGEYVFDCCYLKPNNNGFDKVCRFSYIDYTGGGDRSGSFGVRFDPFAIGWSKDKRSSGRRLPWRRSKIKPKTKVCS